MGAGNFLPGKSEVFPRVAEVEGSTYYEMVYIDASYATGDETVSDIMVLQNEFVYTLMEDIARFLPGSFYADGAWGEWVNRYVKVVLKGEYEGLYFPLFVTPTHPLGIPHTRHTARRLFDGLAARGYTLSTRTGPWTSGRYQPSRCFQAMENPSPADNKMVIRLLSK